jgi:prepilin-type N-terminal cleavage/methylation domain-containing protein
MKFFKQNKGYSLIELTIVLLIIGVIFSLLYVYYPRSKQVQQRIVKASNTEYIDNAIIGFAYSHGRLPIPDTNGNGLEGPGLARGTIPEITLGLAEKPVNKLNIPLTYSVFRKSNANTQQDTDLGVSKDRLYALLPNGTRIASLTPLNQSNTIDFCFALRTAANITVNDPSSLYVSKTQLPIYNRNVAYVLVDSGQTDADGDGNLLDGFNTTGLKFEVSSKLATAAYDDKVNSVDFSELFGALACGSVISAALHAHDNVVLAADMMHTSFIDYSDLLDLTGQLAEVDVALGAAAILQAVAGDADVVAAGATAVAETLTPPFTAIGVPALVEIGISAVIAIAATAAAIATEVLAADALISINKAINCFDNGSQCEPGITGNFVSKAATLTASIKTNAISADAAGL